MWAYLAIAIGGIFGCWARYAMTGLLQAIYGRDFPYATLAINVLGSFLMGFLFIETLERLTLSPYVRTGVLTGFLGGFTTFSTFTIEVAAARRAGRNPEGRALCRALGRGRAGRGIRRRLHGAQHLKGSRGWKPR